MTFPYQPFYVPETPQITPTWDRPNRINVPAQPWQAPVREIEHPPMHPYTDPQPVESDPFELPPNDWN